MSPFVGRHTFRTTNSIESLHSLMAARTDKVDHWKNSNQRQRWVAPALLDIEPDLRRVKGFRHPSLPMRFSENCGGSSTHPGDLPRSMD